MFRERRTKIRITAKSRTPISRWPLPVLKRNRSNTGLNRFGEIASISTTVAMTLVMMRFRRETARRRYLRTAATNRAAAKAPPRNRRAIMASSPHARSGLRPARRARSVRRRPKRAYCTDLGSPSCGARCHRDLDAGRTPPEAEERGGSEQKGQRDQRSEDPGPDRGIVVPDPDGVAARRDRNPLHQIVGREDVDRVPVHGGPPVLVVHGADHHD